MSLVGKKMFAKDASNDGSEHVGRSGLAPRNFYLVVSLALGVDLVSVRIPEMFFRKG